MDLPLSGLTSLCLLRRRKETMWVDMRLAQWVKSVTCGGNDMYKENEISLQKKSTYKQRPT